MMRIILLQDIKALGRRGDIKNVADGYARNFLLPKKLANPATPAAVKEIEIRKEKLEKKFQELKAEMEKIENDTSVTPLVLTVRVGEKGEIFSSVGADELREKVIAKYPQLGELNLKIEADHIRELGRQEIEVELRAAPKSSFAASGKVKGKITIEVEPQPL